MAEAVKIKEKNFKLDINEMIEADLHFGHKTSRLHPKMKPYIFGVRNGVHIIDTEKTLQKMKEAFKFIDSFVSKDNVLLFVGTKAYCKNLIKQTAEQCGFPYVSERWPGGLFTNFKTIVKRIEYFKELENKQKQGELDKYTKKEKALFEKQLKDLEKKFGGIKSLTCLPDAIFVFDMKENALAVKEAKKKGIKVIGIVDTNINPEPADYLIPANDDAISSIKYILSKLKQVILDAKK